MARNFVVTVRVRLDACEAGQPEPIEADARELVRVALECIRADGYESDAVSFEAFAFEACEALPEADPDATCPETGGDHVPAWEGVAPADGVPGVVDVPCKACGCSGSATVQPADIMW